MRAGTSLAKDGGQSTPRMARRRALTDRRRFVYGATIAGLGFLASPGEFGRRRRAGVRAIAPPDVRAMGGKAGS
jgi:hypothetical protein